MARLRHGRRATFAALVGLTVLAGLTVLPGCRAGGDTPPFAADATRNPAPLSPEVRNRNLQLSLARSLERSGDEANALSAYRRVLADVPDHPTALHRLAVLYDRQGDLEQSQALFQRAVQSNPQDAEILCDYGYSLYRQQRLEEAESAFRDALRERPDHRRAHNQLGLILAQTDRRDEAVAEMRRAGCTTAQAHANLALVLSLDGQLDQARSAYHAALSAEPGFGEARSRLQRLDVLIAAHPGPAGESVAASSGASAPDLAPVVRGSTSETPPGRSAVRLAAWEESVPEDGVSRGPASPDGEQSIRETDD